MNTQKMYILVRSDLDPTYRCVQGAHALAQYAIQHPNDFKTWNNSTIVFLGVRYVSELKAWTQKLNGKKYSLYKESDQDMQPTALACYDSGFVFRDLEVAA